MDITHTFRLRTTLAALVLLACPLVAAAKPDRPAPTTVFAMNLAAPLLDRWGGEGETCLEHEERNWLDREGCLLTIGVAVSRGTVDIDGTPTAPGDRARFIDGDLILRLRNPGFRGLGFGIKAGLTSVDGFDARLGVGAEVSHMWRVHEHLMFSPGIGVKGVFGADDRTNIDFIPTLRLNVGVAF